MVCRLTSVPQGPKFLSASVWDVGPHSRFPPPDTLAKEVYFGTPLGVGHPGGDTSAWSVPWGPKFQSDSAWGAGPHSESPWILGQGHFFGTPKGPPPAHYSMPWGTKFRSASMCFSFMIL